MPWRYKVPVLSCYHCLVPCHGDTRFQFSLVITVWYHAMEIQGSSSLLLSMFGTMPWRYKVPVLYCYHCLVPCHGDTRFQFSIVITVWYHAMEIQGSSSLLLSLFGTMPWRYKVPVLYCYHCLVPCHGDKRFQFSLVITVWYHAMEIQGSSSLLLSLFGTMPWRYKVPVLYCYHCLVPCHGDTRFQFSIVITVWYHAMEIKGSSSLLLSLFGTMPWRYSFTTNNLFSPSHSLPFIQAEASYDSGTYLSI